MRRARARVAAVILALAFGASGCDLVSSLTPFGVGTQDYTGGGGNVNGTWAGQTASGGEVTFQVGSDTVSKLHIVHIAGACTLTFDAPTSILIVNDGFTVEIPLDQGRTVASATFTSSAGCSGSYFFEALPTGGCPTAGTGTFVAQKTTL
jgi:hypothetical protein